MQGSLQITPGTELGYRLGSRIDRRLQPTTDMQHRTTDSLASQDRLDEHKARSPSRTERGCIEYVTGTIHWTGLQQTDIDVARCDDREVIHIERLGRSEGTVVEQVACRWSIEATNDGDGSN